MSTENIKTIIASMWEHGHTSDKIKETLINKGFDEHTIAEAIAAYKKEHHAKQLSKGFIFVGIGAFLGFVSCLLSILNPFPDWYNAILYGLTSISILIAFIGLYFIFE